MMHTELFWILLCQVGRRKYNNKACYVYENTVEEICKIRQGEKHTHQRLPCVWNENVAVANWCMLKFVRVLLKRYIHTYSKWRQKAPDKQKWSYVEDQKLIVGTQLILWKTSSCSGAPRFRTAPCKSCYNWPPCLSTMLWKCIGS